MRETLIPRNLQKHTEEQKVEHEKASKLGSILIEQEQLQLKKCSTTTNPKELNFRNQGFKTESAYRFCGDDFHRIENSRPVEMVVGYEFEDPI